MQDTKEYAENTMKHGEYGNERIKFRIKGGRIGKGGNGAVYQIEIVEGREFLEKGWPDVDLNRLVAKFFSCHTEYRKKRYDRFRREVNAQGELCRGISGIVPILDSCCPENFPNEENFAWYIMPEAKNFKVSHTASLVQKLKQILELAYVIQQLHEKEMAHRDIKPDNVFIYRNRICLGDFGLVWAEDFDSLTNSGERIGPIKILPPELESIGEPRGCDYRCSDVYLFAKVLWMYIKKDGQGFRGEYKRGMSQVYLHKHEFQVASLEPLHELLECATGHRYQERCSIDECIEFIGKQIDVCNNTISASDLNGYVCKEELLYFQSMSDADVKIYKDKRAVYEYLKKILQYCTMCFSAPMKNFVINPETVQLRGDGVFMITENIGNVYIKSYLMNIERMVIEENQSVLCTEHWELMDEEFVSATTVSPQLLPTEKRVAFDGSYTVKLIARNT